MDLTPTSNDHIHLVLDSSPMPCAAFDNEGNVLGVNQVAVDLLGMDNVRHYLSEPGEFTTPYHPDGSPSPGKKQEILNQLTEKGQATFEWFHKSHDGSFIPLEIAVKRATLGGTDAAIAYARDLREQKEMLAKIEASYAKEQHASQEKARMEIAEESNRAKSRFLAKMSHEIRTPITSVLGISEIELQNPNLPAHIEESFAKIHNSSVMLLGVVNDILDLSRIEAGKMSLTNEEYETASMISDTANLNFIYLGDKDIEFKMNIDEGIPKYLVGDVIRISQIMSNLLSNAFKYTDSGFVELSVKWEKSKTLVISVSDTGKGMTRKQLDSLYMDYTRFHESADRYTIGTGLGMPIVRNLAQLMDATLDVESRVLKGTTVTVRIPQEPASTETLGKDTVLQLQQFEAHVRADEKRFKFEPEPMPYGSVLVVDDVEANLYVVKGLLAFYDIHVETCQNGYEAINKIQSGNKYDIIFMDHMMPGLNGVETMNIIRGMGYKGTIVALTANAIIGQSEEFIKKGFNAFISKPIQTRHFNMILTKHIRDKHPPEVVEAARAKGRSKRTSNIGSYLEDESTQRKIREDFARKYKNSFSEIKQALAAGDKESAQITAHTVKGIAGLMKEHTLEKIASEVEHTLAAGKKPTHKRLSALEYELNDVLAKIGSQKALESSSSRTFDKDNAREFFDRLEVMLDSRNAESINMTDELRTFPETAILVRQIEEFEFELAHKNLLTLRDVLDV